jgi:hypothetical protein
VLYCDVCSVELFPASHKDSFDAAIVTRLSCCKNNLCARYMLVKCDMGVSCAGSIFSSLVVHEVPEEHEEGVGLVQDLHHGVT